MLLSSNAIRYFNLNSGLYLIKTRNSFYLMFLLNLFIFPGLFAQTNNPTENTGLARVAIISFEDNTGSENYKYLSGSLREAINNSMKKNFTYEAVEFTQTDAVIKDLQKTGNVQKIDLATIKRAAKELKADVVVFGNYTYDEKENMVLFNVSIYLTMADARRDLELTKNMVDNTIFMATEKVSQNLVTNIKQMVEENRVKHAVAQKENSTKVEDKKDEKLVLTKEDTNVGPTWNGKIFSWGIWMYTGFGYLLSDGISKSTIMDKGWDWQLAAIYLRYFPASNLQISLYSDFSFGIGNHSVLTTDPFTNASTYNTVTTIYSALKIVPSIGYRYSMTNFNFFIEAGPGIRMSLQYGNLYGAALGLGAEWLVFNNYAIGLKATSDIFFNFKNDYYVFTPVKGELLFTFVH